MLVVWPRRDLHGHALGCCILRSQVERVVEERSGRHTKRDDGAAIAVLEAENERLRWVPPSCACAGAG